MARSLDRSQLSRALNRWRADPVLFCREVLGFEPWQGQIELMRAVADKRYVACRSGHKVGKTTALGALGLWFVTCFPRSRVVFTAPAAPQIEKGAWAELTRLYHDAAKRGFPLGGTLNETPWTGLKFSDGRDVFGRSTNKKENFAGISAPNLLMLVDEASGVDEEIFEAIFGNAAGNARIVLISNPTQLSGRFYEAFHGKREHWALVHISSEDTPNFHGGSVPGLAYPEWAAMMKAEWGFPSAHYDVRVLGNFPSQASNAVIGFGMVEAALARGREEAPDSTDPLEIGVDVARFGDDSTVFVPARGLWMYPPEIVQSLDVPDVAGRAYDFARARTRFDEVPTLRIDANALGAGVYDLLSRRPHVHTVEINVSTNASDKTRFERLRDELWWGMRTWLELGGALPDAPRLASELIAPTYSYDRSGRIKVEGKKEIKARLGKSPDVADAACLAVYRALAQATPIEDLQAMFPPRRL